MLVYHYPRTGDGTWNSTGTLIDESFDVSCSLSEGETNDVFSFKIPNPRNVWAGFFGQQDNVKIYLSKNNASSSSNNLIMNGLIRGVDGRSDTPAKHLIIKGVNYSEIATTAIGFHTNTNVDVMVFLEGFLGSINDRNPSFPITWDTNNPSLKGDGSAFPKLLEGGQVKEFDKTLYSILNKYLTDKYTGDGGYYWYISNDQKLVIRRKNSDITGTLTEGVDFKTSRVQIGKDIINYVLVKCGLDPNSRPISTRYDDPVSRNKYGFKYAKIERTIGQDLITEQGFGTSNFPSAYPYDTTWKDKDGNTVTVTSDGEWVQAVRTQARRVGVIEGEKYANNRGEGKLTITLTFEPTLNYSVGEVYSISIPSYGVSDKQLRVKDVKYDIYGTEVTLIEEVLA